MANNSSGSTTTFLLSSRTVWALAVSSLLSLVVLLNARSWLVQLFRSSLWIVSVAAHFSWPVQQDYACVSYALPLSYRRQLMELYQKAEATPPPRLFSCFSCSTALDGCRCRGFTRLRSQRLGQGRRCRLSPVAGTGCLCLLWSRSPPSLSVGARATRP